MSSYSLPRHQPAFVMGSGGPPSMNPWEVNALNYEFPEETTANPDGTSAAPGTWRQVEDPVIYPGLYSATGIDVMSILVQLMSRPNPKLELGPIDSSAAIVICDLNLPDTPIVYASDSFTDLTGYVSKEVVGRNCRLLQTPPVAPAPSHENRRTTRSSSRTTTKSVPKHESSDMLTVQQIGQAVRAREEIQVRITNYKKSGQRFTNFLSIIPLAPDASGFYYAVGLQVELE